ncbi:uncharacterized protein LOC120009521 [Tripterygium wilfordii]|uniref:uncharacterized protein LOC120009521 n=1 Tax=Tripterygium wilfordii TaxID=458696 RepID=UPI0018F83E6D|nr:uncharacterized protein LOC120009521 [Tripterygium wilfordii]
MLFQCGWVRRAFKEAGVSRPSSSSGRSPIEQWLSEAVEELSKDQFTRLFSCLWQIWRMRNQVLHNNISAKPEEVGRRIAILLAYYKEAHSLTLRDSKVGIGLIAHDAKGFHIASKSICAPGPLNPLFAESSVAREALVFAKSLNCQDVVLGRDSPLVIKALAGNEMDFSESDLCIGSAKTLLDSFAHVRFSHVKRSANHVVDTLTKYALSSSDSYECFGENPAFLLHVVGTDCLARSS